jgi:hypothetical protein
MVIVGNKRHFGTNMGKLDNKNEMTIKIRVGYTLIKIVQNSEQNDSSYTLIRIWAKLFRCAGQSLPDIVHTNATHELDTFGFYFPLHVSVITY